MIIPFYKMTGAGNDFVMVDNRDCTLSPLLTREHIARLCNRRFGIGADGLIAIEPARNDGDVRMRYYNADGGEAEMCGNGARCFTAFVSLLSGGSITELCFETLAGLVRGQVNADGSVSICLTEPKGLKLNMLPADDVIPAPVHFLNTGPYLPRFTKWDFFRYNNFVALN